MNTFIISGSNLQIALDQSYKISRQNRIDKFDIELVDLEQTLGIEDIRNIQKKIFLKPFRGEKKAIIFKLGFGITVEAQNSMLKLLEEPPLNTLIFLITNNVNSFLPTILSRVKIIEIKGLKPEINEDGLNEILSLDGIGDSLALAQIVGKDKNEAISWLEQTILAARDEMLKKLDDKQECLKYRKLIHKLELTHYDLKTTNANHRLALENLFLNI